MPDTIDKIAARSAAQAAYAKRMKATGFIQKRHWWPAGLADWVDEAARRAQYAHDSDTALVMPRLPRRPTLKG